MAGGTSLIQASYGLLTAGIVQAFIPPVLKSSNPVTSRWVFRATVFKSRTCKGFVGYGDADPSNVSPLVHGAEMRVAETRAVNRALRKAYGIGLCSVEEIGSFAEPVSSPRESKKIPPQPINGKNGNYAGLVSTKRACRHFTGLSRVVGLGNQSHGNKEELDDQSTTIPRPLPPLGGHFPRHLKMTLILPRINSGFHSSQRRGALMAGKSWGVLCSLRHRFSVPERCRCHGFIWRADSDRGRAPCNPS
jgi:hypothetical protein